MSTGGHQPYAQGARQPGQALAAMLSGKPVFLPNPTDLRRQTMRRDTPSQQLAALLMQVRNS